MPIGFVPVPKRNNKNALDELVTGENDNDDQDDQISYVALLFLLPITVTMLIASLNPNRTTSTNFGERRPKNETPEERKNRKKAVKDSKKVFSFSFFFFE